MTLATLEDFKHQLGLPLDGGTDDGLLQMKLEQATFLVLQWITRSDDTDQAAEIATWAVDPAGGSPPDVPVPWDVHAAVLQWASELYRFRGDDLDDVKRDNPGDPSPSVKALLYRRRRPVVA